MPYDAQVTSALDAVRAAIEEFRGAVRGAQAQMIDYVDEHRVPAASRTEVAATALGRFASGRLDATRFAAAFDGPRTMSPDALERVSRCIEVLGEILAAGDDAFVVDLPAASDTEAALEAAYARLGRAFGAVLAFQAVKTGVHRDDVHDTLLVAFPFAQWNRAERLLAPPLVVSVDGAGLDALRLARFLDGRSRIVLVVRGAMAPAALVQLVTPGVLVMQADDASALGRLAQSTTPAIAAIVGADAARFVHDPRGGARIADRLTIQATPKEAPRRAAGPWSAAQQSQQLAQLASLAAAARAESEQAATEAIATAESVVSVAAASGDAGVDRLTGWLLAQAGFASGAASGAAR